MGEKIRIQVSQPNVIKAYNEGMTGVDMVDRLLESYRPGATMKKCFFLFFFYKHINCECYNKL